MKTITELSEELNVSEQTLRLWEKSLELDISRDRRNRRTYRSEDIDIIRNIKELRDKDSGFNTIRKVIKPETIENKESETSIESKFNLNESFIEVIQDRLEHTLVKNNELSEKYAKATYKIGELEATNKFLLQENEKLNQDIKLLPDPVAVEKLNLNKVKLEHKLENFENKSNQIISENTRLNQENEKLQERLQQFEMENKDLKLPWWKKIFK